MSVTADPAGAGDPSLGGWYFWNMQKNRGLSGASTSAVKNEGYSIWTMMNDEWRPRSPVPADPLAAEYYHDMADFYLEAARRLPIADIPGLARCISTCGLAVGLADPVTNIVLTTINAFAKKPPGPGYFSLALNPDDALEKTRKKITFADGARNSRAGLIMFMLCYFRNMTVAEAKKFLDMAGHDLPLAILLVESGCRGWQVPLQPDVARTKTALQRAAYSAGCRKTDDLVRLMTWRYPRDLLDPVLDDLRGGKQLSAHCIYKICNLLRCSWPVPPNPTPTLGTRRDSSGNITTVIKIRKGIFATTTISKDFDTTTTITSTCPSRDDCTDDGVHLSNVLAGERNSRVASIVCTWQKNPDFLPLLKLSLLATMHDFYIEALGTLPDHALRERHLLSAVLTAGHCYGPMDPVSNIILNSIWYEAVFPLPKDVSNQIGAADILDARAMSRVESRSLDGFVAFVCYTYSISEQQAVLLLCQHRFNLSCLLQNSLQSSKKIFFDLGSAALVAKHPQPTAFKDFLNSTTPSKFDRLRSLMSNKASGNVLSDDTLKQLKNMVSKKTADTAATMIESMPPNLGQSALETLSAKRSTFKSQQAYVRKKLEILLLDYGRSEGHIYKLGIICGVKTATYRYHTTCFHVNFLASSDVPNDATRSYCASELFFAEFWSIADDKVEQSTNLPFCCPVRDFFESYSIRCIVCDYTSCRIAHPSSGEYFTGTTQCEFPVHHRWGADLGGMLELDYIYFDGRSDEFAKILSKEYSSSPRKPKARDGAKLAASDSVAAVSQIVNLTSHAENSGILAVTNAGTSKLLSSENSNLRKRPRTEQTTFEQDRFPKMQ